MSSRAKGDSLDEEEASYSGSSITLHGVENNINNNGQKRISNRSRAPSNPDDRPISNEKYTKIQEMQTLLRQRESIDQKIKQVEKELRIIEEKEKREMDLALGTVLTNEKRPKGRTFGLSNVWATFGSSSKRNSNSGFNSTSASEYKTQSIETSVENSTDPKSGNNSAAGILTEHDLNMLWKEDSLLFFAQNRRDELISRDPLSESKSPVRLLIEAATLDQLVNRIISTSVFDTTLATDFFLTYTNFASSRQILDLIKKRFDFSPPADISQDESEKYKKWKPMIRIRACNALKLWMERNWKEYQKDQDFARSVANFVQNEVNTFNSKTAKSLLELFEKTLDRQHGGLRIQELEPAPETIMTIGAAEINEDSIHSLSVIELARQLTLYEYDILKCITPDQMNHAQWTTKDREVCSPDIAKLTQWFNQLTYWIANEILSRESIKERAARIGFWIDVAATCYQLNNYNSMMEIITTLSMYVIVRLKRTWKAISQSHESKLRELQQVLSQELNYKNYRAHLNNLLIRGDVAVLPYLGIHLRDIIYLCDGNPDLVEVDVVKKCFCKDDDLSDSHEIETGSINSDKSEFDQLIDELDMRLGKKENLDTNSSKLSNRVTMIHFTKQRLIGQTIRIIQQCQEKPYNFRVVRALCNTFNRMLDGKKLSDDHLWKLSKQYDSLEKDTTTPISELESPYGKPAQRSHEKISDRRSHGAEKSSENTSSRAMSKSVAVIPAVEKKEKKEKRSTGSTFLRSLPGSEILRSHTKRMYDSDEETAEPSMLGDKFD